MTSIPSHSPTHGNVYPWCARIRLTDTVPGAPPSAMRCACKASCLPDAPPPAVRQRRQVVIATRARGVFALRVSLW